MASINEYVVFEIENEYYGIDIKLVENIEKPKKITRVPYTKDFIEGVVNLRGNIIPVLYLRKRFDIGYKEMDEDSRIIIINYKEYNVGLIVDSSSEVVQLKDSKIENAPKIKDDIKLNYVKEVGKDEDRIIMLLDMKKVLDIKDKKDE
ncbi:MAG: chemotaxis protein CheW [Bacillota bacterium]